MRAIVLLSRKLLLVLLIQLVVVFVAPTAGISPIEETSGATDAGLLLSSEDVDPERRQPQRDLKGNVYIGAPGTYIDFTPKTKAPEPTPPATAPASTSNNSINGTALEATGNEEGDMGLKEDGTPQVMIQDDDNTDDFIPKLPPAQQAAITAQDPDDEPTDYFVPVPAPTFKTTQGVLVGYKDEGGELHSYPGMEVPGRVAPEPAPVEEEEVTLIVIELNPFKRLLLAVVGFSMVACLCSCCATKKRAKAKHVAYQAASFAENESVLEMGSMDEYRDDVSLFSDETNRKNRVD